HLGRDVGGVAGVEGDASDVEVLADGEVHAVDRGGELLQGLGAEHRAAEVHHHDDDGAALRGRLCTGRLGAAAGGPAKQIRQVDRPAGRVGERQVERDPAADVVLDLQPPRGGGEVLH